MTKKMYSIYLEPELIDAMKEYAKARERSTSSLMRIAVREYMKNHPVEGDG